MNCLFCQGDLSVKGKCMSCSTYPISNVYTNLNPYLEEPSGSFEIKIGKTKFGVICRGGYTEILTYYPTVSYLMKLENQTLHPNNALKKLGIYLTFI